MIIIFLDSVDRAGCLVRREMPDNCGKFIQLLKLHIKPSTRIWLIITLFCNRNCCVSGLPSLNFPFNFLTDGIPRKAQTNALSFHIWLKRNKCYRCCSSMRPRQINFCHDMAYFALVNRKCFLQYYQGPIPENQQFLYFCELCYLGSCTMAAGRIEEDVEIG